MTHSAIIAGAGTHSDFSLALVRSMLASGREVAVIVRREETRAALLQRLAESASRTSIHVADLTDAACIQSIVQALDERAPIDVVVHNAARLVIAPFAETTPAQFEEAWRANVGSALPIAQAALAVMAARKSGTFIFTGATASIRGGAKFAPFASAKFALRGLSQSLAREYGPRGVHVAHVIVDGILWGDRARDTWSKSAEDCIDADALAAAYMSLLAQPTSCWTHELDVRPASESF